MIHCTGGTATVIRAARATCRPDVFVRSAGQAMLLSAICENTPADDCRQPTTRLPSLRPMHTDTAEPGTNVAREMQ